MILLKRPYTLLLCVFLVSSISLTSLQVLAQTNAVEIRTPSYGTIAYTSSTPTPTPTPISTPTPTPTATTPSTPTPTPTPISTPTPTPTATTPSTPTPTPTPISTPTPTPTPSTITLHVEGTRIKDANGNTVKLEAVNWDFARWLYQNHDFNTQFTYIKNMGCNTVSIGIFGYSGGYPDVYNDPEFSNRLDTIMSVTANKGLYVILRSFVDAGLQTVNPDFVVTTITRIAQRYAAYNHIIYEPASEALNIPHSTYQSMIQRSIDAIRTYRPDAIISVAAESPSDWDAFGFGFQQNYPINRPNIIFAFDPYGFQSYPDNSQSGIRSLFSWYGSNWILSHGFPVILSEFGGNDAPYDSWSQTWATNCMTVCDTDGYSGYSAWRWITASEETSWNLITDWNGNLSPWGNTIKTYYTTH